MLGLISNHLHATLIATGKLSLMRNQIDMASLLEDIIYHHTLIAKERNISVHLDAKERPSVRIDIARMQDVLSQLLEAAMLDSESGSRVQISVSQNSREARVIIQSGGRKTSDENDTNWGIIGGREMPVRFFCRSIESSLSLIHQIIEHHGGRLWTSNTGSVEGATFIVELPLF